MPSWTYNIRNAIFFPLVFLITSSVCYQKSDKTLYEEVENAISPYLRDLTRCSSDTINCFLIPEGNCTSCVEEMIYKIMDSIPGEEIRNVFLSSGNNIIPKYCRNKGQVMVIRDSLYRVNQLMFAQSLTLKVGIINGNIISISHIGKR